MELKENDSRAVAGIKPGRYVELIVRDTGTGMDTSVQSRIFEPFFTTKAAEKGTGLGLSTVYGIVQQAGGSVSFMSAPGEGTVFHVLLPRIDAPVTTAPAVIRGESSARGAETVLLVEDDRSVWELVRGVLSSNGYTVLYARNPQDAEKLCEEHRKKIDLLLTDVIMPGISGAELSKRLTANYPHLKVIFMSGYIDDSIVRQGVRRNEVSFLQKPFLPSSLARKVREVLDTAPVS